VKCTIPSCQKQLVAMVGADHLWCPHCHWQYIELPLAVAVAEESGLTRDDVCMQQKIYERGRSQQ